MPNGTLAKQTDRVFVDLRGSEPGVPDGMKVDVEGNIYYGGAGGLWIMAMQPSFLPCGITPGRRQRENPRHPGADPKEIAVLLGPWAGVTSLIASQCRQRVQSRPG
jgi:hypothetical protein